MAWRRNKKADRNTIDTVFVLLGLVAILVLIMIGSIALVASNFARGNVTHELSSQKIFFPSKTDAGYLSLPSADQEAMAQYAGQQLVDGDQAEVYANHYIAVHLAKIADGKTYSEVSAAANANPGDTKLQNKAAKLFQGETLRGMLLGSGYAYWTMGTIAFYAAVASYLGAFVMFILVVLGSRRIVSSR